MGDGGRRGFRERCRTVCRRGFRGARRSGLTLKTLIDHTLAPGRKPGAESPRRFRRLRRVEDAMIYEAVLVGSAEDALLASIMNGKIEAVVIYDDVPVPSLHDVPLLRDFLASHHHLDTSSMGVARDRPGAAASHQAASARNSIFTC